MRLSLERDINWFQRLEKEQCHINPELLANPRLNHVQGIIKTLNQIFDVPTKLKENKITITISGVNLNQLIKKDDLICKKYQSKIIFVTIQQMAGEYEKLNVINIILDRVKLII